MKKVMVMLGAVALAACAQAVAIDWGLSTGKVKLNGTALGGATVQLYIVGVDSAVDALVDTRTTSKSPSAGGLSSNHGTTQTISYNDTVAGGALWSADDGDLGRQYYFVVTASQGDDTYTYTSSYATSSGLTDKSNGKVSWTFNDEVVTSGTDGWVKSGSPTPTPEPTSGLLLLVGMAGLALRRRRA